ncbi:MAG: Sua5/YciO/YrdC/YwlC family protein [Sulfuricellaceae bacterium]|nr:Sua5/YciO/YrdC/YwlC family protein [Sulfuricellaceae bacterium]
MRLSASTAALNAALVRKLRRHLKQGGVIAYPTESCYGLGCDPRNRRAVMRLLSIKGRPQSKGLILIGATFSQLKSYASPLNGEQWRQISPTWPGPVTWLLPAARSTPSWLSGHHASIAVRVTAHPLASRLCKSVNTALVSTSANRAGLKPARTYADCVKTFGNSVLVVPGMTGKRRHPSTIMELTTGRKIR